MHDYIIKQKSQIDGRGIFATQDIEEGEVFYRIPQNYITHPKFHCAKLADGIFIDDEIILNWVNHSCSPNAEIVKEGSCWCLKSLKQISAGEEIFCDYNKTEKGGEKMSCKCGDKKCRGYFLRVI
jgi:uncharacterized protein